MRGTSESLIRSLACTALLRPRGTGDGLPRLLCALRPATYVACVTAVNRKARLFPGESPTEEPPSDSDTFCGGGPTAGVANGGKDIRAPALSWRARSRPAAARRSLLARTCTRVTMWTGVARPHGDTG